MADLLLTQGPKELRRSPAAHEAQTALPSAAVTLREVPFLTQVALRAEPGSPAAQRLGAALGTALPGAVGETTAAGEHAVLWLGPDEWLLVSETEPRDVVPALLDALGEDPGAVVDVSANRTTLELRGPAARAVLEKGCPTDLHPRAFGPGRAVTTTLGPVPVLLWQTGPEAYRVLPRSSFAAYVARWLRDGMDEYIHAGTD